MTYGSGMNRQHELAWAAGLFEGEGSIHAAEKRGRYCPGVQVGMTDQPVVQHLFEVMRFGAVYGPYAKRKPNWKPCVTWQATGWTAFHRTRSMFEGYLGERRTAKFEEIALLEQPPLKNQNTAKTHCPQGHPYRGENLIINSQGRRVCRTCERARTRVWNEKRRLAKIAERDS